MVLVPFTFITRFIYIVVKRCVLTFNWFFAFIVGVNLERKFVRSADPRLIFADEIGIIYINFGSLAFLFLLSHILSYYP